MDYIITMTKIQKSITMEESVIKNLETDGKNHNRDFSAEVEYACKKYIESDKDLFKNPEQIKINFQHTVTIDFPEDPKELVKVLDWMWNDNGFGTMNMADDVIEKARKAGIKVTILKRQG